MKLHEYQASLILQEYGIPISKRKAIFQKNEVAAAFKEVAHPTCMAKVQVLMGGRGKAGGVKEVKTLQEAEAFVDQFLGKPFSTYQSGGESKPVKAILFAEMAPILEEYYLGVTIDRSHRQPVILFCKEGGVDIEEIAASRPEAILKIHYSVDNLPSNQDILKVVAPSFKDKSIAEQVSVIAAKLAKAFVEKDAAICEINPLVLSADNAVIALDAKVVIDDNALFRHADLQTLKDPDEEDARERQAKAIGLSYVSMNGNVGCLVNGAGLAMATMDMIKLAGGEPANFLDVGGGANAEQVREAFKIILQDPKVKAILVNIFGGIMKCDVIAEGILQASKEIKLKTPLVVRLEGTRVKEGRELLEKSGLQIHSCHTIGEAAKTAVSKAKEFETQHVHTHS